MLEGLAQVDWSQFHHAYGAATDVPDLLRALAWPDQAAEAILREAQGSKRGVVGHVENVLYGNVFHQGTRWGVSAKVVPFLRELLAVPERRAFILGYLHHLARGYPTQAFPELYPLEEVLTEGARVEALNPPASAVGGDVFGEDVDETWAETVPVLWERDCFLAVEACVPEVAKLLGGPDALEALALIASFPRATSTHDALWGLVHGASSDGRRGAALVSLAQHGVDIGEAAQVVLDQVDGVDAVYAAAAEVLSKGDRASVFSWSRLLDVPADLAARECPFAGTLSKLVALCLERCTPDVQAEAIDQLSVLLENAKGLAKNPLTHALLRLAFKRERPATWSAQQREVLEVIAEHGFWQFGADHLMKEFGLPATRDGLRAKLV